MSKQSFLGKHWKLLINVITIVALIILIYLIRKQLLSTVENLGHVKAWALLLLIPIEILNYHAQTKLYQKLFKIVGNKLKYKFLFKAALELNLVNHLFPSGGVTGISYFGLRFRNKKKISGGKATLIQIIKLVLTLLSFEVLLIIGLFILAIFGKVSNITILVAGVMTTLLIVLTILFAYIAGSKARINNFFTFITQAINLIIYKLFRRQPESINIMHAKEVFDDFHENYQQLVDHWRELKSPFRYALLANITEILAIYVVYIAFGKYVNIGAIIIAYGVANFAGLISFLPGGIGIYEALMTVVLASAGVPPKLSLPVTIMYRVLNTLIQLPPGYYLYHKNLNKNDRSSLKAITK